MALEFHSALCSIGLAHINMCHFLPGNFCVEKFIVFHAVQEFLHVVRILVMTCNAFTQGCQEHLKAHGQNSEMRSPASEASRKLFDCTL